MITVADLRVMLKDWPDDFVVTVLNGNGVTSPIDEPRATLVGAAEDNVRGVLLTPAGTFQTRADS